MTSKNVKKLSIFMILASVCISASCAKVLFKNSVDSWDNKNVKSIADGAFSVAGNNVILSSDLIEVKDTSQYSLSGKFKGGSSKKGKFFLGVAPYDKDKKQIRMIEVNPVYQSDTVLVEDCRANDKIIKIKNGLNWKQNSYVAIAFNTQKLLKELPNRDLSSRGIEKIEKKEGYWNVYLKNPCGKAYPAGTSVREHSAGSSYIYCSAFAKTATVGWKTASGTIGKIAVKANNHNRKNFWPGTCYVKVLLYANYLCKPDVVLDFKDISFKELNK